jgi:hypothetical protein
MAVMLVLNQVPFTRKFAVTCSLKALYNTLPENPVHERNFRCK